MRKRFLVYLALVLTGAFCTQAAAFEGYGGNSVLADENWNFLTVDGNVLAVPAGEGDVLKIARNKEGADYLLEGTLLTCLVRGDEYDYIYEYDLEQRHREVLLALNKNSAFLGRETDQLYYLEADETDAEEGILGGMDYATLEIIEYAEDVKAAVYDGKNLYALVWEKPVEKKTDVADDEAAADAEEKEPEPEETVRTLKLMQIDPDGRKRTLKRGCGMNLLWDDGKIFFDLEDGTMCMAEDGKVQKTAPGFVGARYLYAEEDRLYLRKADGGFAYMDLTENQIKTWETPSGTVPERIRDQGKVYWTADDILYDADFGIVWQAAEGEELLTVVNGKKVIQGTDGSLRRE